MTTKYRPQRRKVTGGPAWQAVEDAAARSRPLARMPLWWHMRVLGHDQTVRRVSVPAFDPSARGLLIDCSCGVGWAK